MSSTLFADISHNSPVMPSIFLDDDVSSVFKESYRGFSVDPDCRFHEVKNVSCCPQDRKFKIELQFSVSDIDLNNLYLKTPRG